MLFAREHLVSVTRTSDGAHGVARFPASWELFRGHFPGRPVVPAYVLIGFARAVAEEALGAPVELAGIDRVKLARPVAPGENVACTVVVERTAVEGDGALRRARAQLSTDAGPVGTAVLSIRVGS